VSEEEAARWVLTLTDSFLGRGYPEPDRDMAAAVNTAKEMIARVLRRPEVGETSR
jgi:hypothetical protein